MNEPREKVAAAKSQIDTAGFNAPLKLLVDKNRKNASQSLGKGVLSLIRCSCHAVLSLVKSIAEQTKRLGRWLQWLLQRLLGAFFFLSDLLIVIGLRSGSILFLGLSILETLNNYPDVSWMPYAGFIAFSKAATANRRSKDKK